MARTQYAGQLMNKEYNVKKLCEAQQLNLGTPAMSSECTQVISSRTGEYDATLEDEQIELSWDGWL